MKSQNQNIRILTTYSEVAPFLPSVIAAADSDKDALGFFPKRVFADYARKELLFVAADRSNGELTYAGHLLFDVRVPQSHVRQIYVADPYRRLGIGELLVNELKKHLTDLQFTCIIARVGEDLRDSNAFWERQNFYTQRVVDGGATKKRLIVVRAHELATPQLFSSSGISAADPLGLDISLNDAKPLFLLDLNVLFDLGPRRPRHENAIAIFRAERMSICSLAISSEIHKELKRTATKGKTDPMQSLAKTLPEFSSPPEDAWELLAPKLGKLIFPERTKNGSLSANDVSDLKHLATAIYHGLPGLITSDEAVLCQAHELRRMHGLEVISPSSFQAGQPDHIVHESYFTSSDLVLTIEPASVVDEAEIQSLLHHLDVPAVERATKWAVVDGSSLCKRFVVRDSATVVGYLLWPQSLKSNIIDALMAVREDTPVVKDAVQLMLNHLSANAANSDIALVRLTCPHRQATLREVAATFGYTAVAENSSQLQKIIVRRILMQKNWQEVQRMIADTCAVYLPESVPIFRHVDQQLPVLRADGQRTFVSFSRLESLLSPVLFGLHGREGVLVPLRPRYAEHLLEANPQATFLPRSRAQLFQQRHYLSGYGTLRAFRPGGLLFFYESGSTGAVVAVARVLRAYHRDVGAMSSVDLTPSVLESDSLKDIGSTKLKTITVFDNLLHFPVQVTREFLVSIGCGEPHQLMTSRPLSAEQVQKILCKGISGDDGVFNNLTGRTSR